MSYYISIGDFPFVSYDYTDRTISLLLTSSILDIIISNIFFLKGENTRLLRNVVPGSWTSYFWKNFCDQLWKKVFFRYFTLFEESLTNQYKLLRNGIWKLGF